MAESVFSIRYVYHLRGGRAENAFPEICQETTTGNVDTRHTEKNTETTTPKSAKRPPSQIL